MSNNTDVEKILQSLKKSASDTAVRQQPAQTGISNEQLQQIVAREAANSKQTAQNTQTAQHCGKGADFDVPKADAAAENSAEIENEFLSKLATALKDNPAVSDLVENADENLEEKSKNTVSINASSYVDEKFVDFFTTTVAVERQPINEITIKRKKGGFFKKKYITDSLSLSIPQQEIDKRQLKVSKFSEDIAVDSDIEQSTDSTKENDSDQKEKRGFFGRKKAKATQQNDDMPLFMRYKSDDEPASTNAENETSVFLNKNSQKESDCAVSDIPSDSKNSADNIVNETEQSKTNNETPKDAESIIKSLKAKKQNQAKIVATDGASSENPIVVTKIKPSVDSEPTVELKEKHSPFVPKKETFDDTIENTAFIPSQFAQPDEKSVEFVPKNPEDQKVKHITGDITQLFASAGVTGKSTQQLNADNDEEDEEEVFETEEESFENEYITQQFSDDPSEIFDELKSFKATLAIRMGLSAVCAFVLLYLNFAAGGIFPLPAIISPTTQPMMFYLVNIVFLAIALIGFLPTLANGILGFVKTPTQDSFLVVPSIWSFLQLCACTFSKEPIDPASITIFASVTVFAFGFNALGKYINATTIMRNLRLAEVPQGINAGYIIKDMEDVKRLARTLEEKNPHILVSRKTGYISNFISGGFSTHKSEKNSKILSIITAGVSVICFGLGWKLLGGWQMGFCAAAGASIIMLPLAHSLISSLPSSLMQKVLNKAGTLVNGWQGIYQLSDATHVSFDAKHLFPKGSVVLHGIKTFEKERLDLAILYAASIAIEHIDNLRSVFMTVIDGKKDMLFPIENCEYKVGQGYVAWIENNRVIMGNRSIMEEYDISLPPVSTESAYLSEGKKPIYLSVNGKLFGMFVVSYHPDQAVRENLIRLIESGKCIILQSNDFNVDNQLLELVYALPRDTVQVLNKNETALLLNYTAYSESTDSAMAHLDSLYSLAAGFFGADSARRAANTCSAIQIISVFAGAVLSIVFTASKTLCSIPLTSVLLLALGWLGLSLMRAVATKYY